jgi:mutator protein MutT
MQRRLGTEPQVYRGLVSVKGVIIRDEAVILLRNERDEWELPGGKLELGETPEACLAREIAEELGLSVRVGPVLDTWLYEHIVLGSHVFIVTYGCHAEPSAKAECRPEHVELAWRSADQVDAVHMPDGYKRSILRWVADPRRIHH